MINDMKQGERTISLTDDISGIGIIGVGNMINGEQTGRRRFTYTNGYISS